jgi:hypothetical protein
MGFSRQNLSGAKLNGEMVLWGRKQYQLHIDTQGRQGMNMRQIADVQQVSRETVARYLRGETWKQFGLPGEHEAAQEQRIENMAKQFAPALDSAEIQASLAKLARLGITGKPSEERKDDLPKRSDDLPTDTGRGPDDLPGGNPGVDQPGEAKDSPDDGRASGTERPAG